MRGLLLALPMTFAASAQAADVLLLETSGHPALSANTHAMLAASGRYATVDVWRGDVAVAQLADLTPYDAVLVSTNLSWLDAAAQGDALADYVDGGGGLVLTTFDFAAPALQGRLPTLMPLLTPSGRSFGPSDSLGPRAAHPLTDGVRAFVDPKYHSPDADGAHPAEVVARYTSGAALAAWRTSGGGTLAALNLIPVSDDVGAPYGPGFGDFWDPAGDGARWVNNAVTFVAGIAPSALEVIATGTCPGPVRLVTRGASPSTRFAVVTGTRLSAATIPGGPCRGMPLPVGAPTLRAVRQADPFGRDALVVPSAPPAACGATVVIIDLTTCRMATATLP